MFIAVIRKPLLHQPTAQTRIPTGLNNAIVPTITADPKRNKTKPVNPTAQTIRADITSMPKIRDTKQIILKENKAVEIVLV